MWSYLANYDIHPTVSVINFAQHFYRTGLLIEQELYCKNKVPFGTNGLFFVYCSLANVYGPPDFKKVRSFLVNESTTGADASVEAPKLYDMKLLDLA